VLTAANTGRRLAICLCCDEVFLPVALFLVCQIDTAAPGRCHDIRQWPDVEPSLPAAFADRGFRLVRPEPGPDCVALQTAQLARSTCLRLRLADALGDDDGRSGRLPARCRQAHAAFLDRCFPASGLHHPSPPAQPARIGRRATTPCQHVLSVPAFLRLIRRLPEAGRTAR
jgi:hypothetical protein